MKPYNPKLLITTGLALCALAITGSAATAASEKTTMNAADARFIQEEAPAGVSLVQLAKLGESKAQNADVKSFAAMLVADHTKANTQLAALAASKNIEVSSKPASKYKDAENKLEQVKAADFDREFLAMIINGHEKCIKNFEEASTGAQDTEVKAWAAAMLPSLQAHLVKAESLNSGLTSKADSKSTKNTGIQADNTALNARDRDMNTMTPMDQGNSKSDTDMTAQIRREVIEQKELSVNAHNVKALRRNEWVKRTGLMGAVRPQTPQRSPRQAFRGGRDDGVLRTGD